MSDGAISKLAAFDAIRDDRTLTSAERLVLLMLLSHTRPSDGTCFPSLELLALETGFSRSTVASAIASIRERLDSPVLVTVVHRGNGSERGGRASNVYRLRLNPMVGRKSKPVESNGRTEVPPSLSPPDAPKTPSLESDKPTQPGGDLSPIGGEVESKIGGDLSPAAGPEAGQEARNGNTSGSSKRSRKSDEPPNPNVPKLWDHHHVEYERVRGIPPEFTKRQRGAVGRAWKDMLEVVDFEEAKLIVTRALERGYHTQPTAIVANMNSYRGKDPKPNGKVVAVQRGADDAVVANYGRSGAEKLAERARRLEAAEQAELDGLMGQIGGVG